MSYDVNKLTKLAHLKTLATKLNTEINGLKEQVEALEEVGAQANVLEGVKVNGVALEIAQKMVDILIATGTANGTLAVNGTTSQLRAWPLWPTRLRCLRLTWTPPCSRWSQTSPP